MDYLNLPKFQFLFKRQLNFNPMNFKRRQPNSI